MELLEQLRTIVDQNEDRVAKAKPTVEVSFGVNPRRFRLCSPLVFSWSRLLFAVVCTALPLFSLDLTASLGRCQVVPQG